MDTDVGIYDKLDPCKANTVIWYPSLGKCLLGNTNIHHYHGLCLWNVGKIYPFHFVLQKALINLPFLTLGAGNRYVFTSGDGLCTIFRTHHTGDAKLP